MTHNSAANMSKSLPIFPQDKEYFSRHNKNFKQLMYVLCSKILTFHINHSILRAFREPIGASPIHYVIQENAKTVLTCNNKASVIVLANA